VPETRRAHPRMAAEIRPMRLIPAIDLRGGRCVRLLRGDFAAETRYDAEPRALLAKYRGYGADWIHVVDLDGARDGSAGNRGVIAELAAEPDIKLQVGGGLRDVEAVERTLAAGVARIVVGSAAVTQPEEVARWLARFGSDRVALALDVRIDASGTPRLATHGWQRQSALSLWQAVLRFEDAGLVHVLCTDVSRDGALSGPNLDLYTDAARRFTRIAWQASGGIRDARDLGALGACGVSAAVSGKALLDDLIPLEELAPFLPNA
jgi:phosphoribosylformimino-5-aminoimidazole carboxamide ribotide isomerase